MEQLELQGSMPETGLKEAEEDILAILGDLKGVVTRVLSVSLASATVMLLLPEPVELVLEAARPPRAAPPR